MFVITPHPIPPETVTSIVGALRSTGDGRVQFVGGAALMELFKTHWPEYLAEEFSLIQSYADALTETAETATELRGLSFQYQLGAVDTSIKRVYVQPHLHRFVRSYSLRPLYQNLPSGFSDWEQYSEGEIEDIKKKLKTISAFISNLLTWGLCREPAGPRARAACSELIDEITKAWSLALAARAARTKAKHPQSDGTSLKLSNTHKLNKALESLSDAVNEALRILEQNVHLADQYIQQQKPDASFSFSTLHERVLNNLGEIARISGNSCMREINETSRTFTGAMITAHPGSIFIVGPAGFGKTSFCRWNALNDVERLLQGQSNTLPVYVPLHQVTDIDKKDFKGAFLQHAGVSALLPKGGRTQYEKTRVYLDGLDEVPSAASQKHIAQLAHDATKADPKLQVIITARDYVYGPWITWLPRVHLSGFDDGQISELVSKWLNNDKKKIDLFFAQLAKSSALGEMMTIPLLAALIVLVFKQTDKLPENKTRLYEIFVDLHNGGWDLVKSIQRPSHFGAAEKMFVLKRIAATIHEAKRREMLEADVARVSKATLKELDWKVLRDELLRDGLIVQMGSMISFAHHSFQEFLTARYLLGGLNTTYLTTCCDEYLKGSDWWQEVLCFYVDLAAKPQEIAAWIDERWASVARYADSRSTTASERARFLKRYLSESFPFAR